MIEIKHCLVLAVTVVACLGVDPALPKHIIQVYGNASLGYYYLNLYIGTPPQEQSVIIDTGSGQLAVPCSRCVSCGNSHIHPPFDLKDSSSNKIITCNSENELCRQRCNQKTNQPCSFSISYAEGSSLSGIIIEDTIQFEPASKGEAITTSFGCTIRETNLFYTQAANGIFGLAPFRKARLLDILYEKHSPHTGQEFLFSICLAKNGGLLAIGKAPEEITNGKPSVKTTFNPDHNLYSLEGVGQIRINQTVIGEGSSLGFYGLFVDSGSTFTYLPSGKYQIFFQQIENSCAYYSQQCKIAKKSGMKCVKLEVGQGRTLRQALLDIFPSFDIQINGQVIHWLPDRYFLLRNSRTGEACLGIQSLDRFLLGANWMVDRNVVFNLKQRTVQVYSGVSCASSSDKEDLPLYMNDDSGSLPYISAVLKLDEGLLTKFLMLVLVGIVVVGLLMCMGVYALRRNSEPQKHLGEEQNVTIAEISQGRGSHRHLDQEHSSENHESIEEKHEEKIPVEVDTLK